MPAKMTPAEQFQCKWFLFRVVHRSFPNNEWFRKQNKLSVYQVRRSHAALENYVCQKLGIQQNANRMNLVYIHRPMMIVNSKG